MNYKVLFLIFSLFFINNVGASVFEENFNTQTLGVFSIGTDGSFSYPSTTYNHSLTHLFYAELYNDSLTYGNFTFTVDLKSSDAYDNIELRFYNSSHAFYNDLDMLIEMHQYYTFENYDSSGGDHINSDYNEDFTPYLDGNGWLHIKMIVNNTQMALYLNDILVHTYPITNSDFTDNTFRSFRVYLSNNDANTITTDNYLITSMIVTPTPTPTPTTDLLAPNVYSTTDFYDLLFLALLIYALTFLMTIGDKR